MRELFWMGVQQWWIVHTVGGVAMCMFMNVNDLTTTDRSHEDQHSTKLTNVGSKFNVLNTGDHSSRLGKTKSSCRQMMAAEWAEADVLIGYCCNGFCAFWVSELSPSLWLVGVVANGKCHWLPLYWCSHRDFGTLVLLAQDTWYSTGVFVFIETYGCSPSSAH